MKIDTGFAPQDFHAASRIARGAEEVGFDALWIPEANHDPFLSLALAAEATERIHLGTGIALAFIRSPMALAYTCWDLQALSGGRFILGLGTQVKGHNERRFSVRWEHPVARLREVVLALRAIWKSWRDGSRLDFRGDHYTFTLMTPFFTPPPISHPEIPIYLSGVNRRICQLAGEVADGFHLHPFHTDRYIREVVRPNIEAGAARSGRSHSDVTLATSVFVVTGNSPEERARSADLLRTQIAFYASTRTYRAVLDLHGWGEVCDRLHAMVARGQWDKIAGEISDEMIATFAVEGPFEEIPSAIQRKYGGLLDRVALYLPYQPGGDDQRWRALVRSFREAA